MVKKLKEIRCAGCGKKSFLISSTLGVCIDCIRDDFENVKELIKKAHQKTREEFDLPLEPPQNKEGIACSLCINSCKIPQNGRSFCGLRENKEGELRGASHKEELRNVRIGNVHLLSNDY